MYLKFTATALRLHMNEGLSNRIQLLARLELCQISDELHIGRTLRGRFNALLGVRITNSAIGSRHNVYGQTVAGTAIAQNGAAIELEELVLGDRLEDGDFGFGSFEMVLLQQYLALIDGILGGQVLGLL